MNMKYGLVLIVVGLTWSLYLLGQLAMVSAIGLSSILWMVFAVSCAMGSRTEREGDIIGIITERDLL